LLFGGVVEVRFGGVFGLFAGAGSQQYKGAEHQTGQDSHRVIDSYLDKIDPVCGAGYLNTELGGYQSGSSKSSQFPVFGKTLTARNNH
jgi:hypothetical protein